MNMTLEQSFDLVRGLYGEKNKIHLRGDTPLRLIGDAQLTLGRMVRKGERDKYLLSGALASMFARLWSYADTFGNLPIVQELARKYPSNVCAYCGSMPCICQLANRPDIKDRGLDPAQLSWSIQDWCTHLDKTYGANNRKNGLLMAFHRLGEEVREVEKVDSFDTKNRRLGVDELKGLYAREFADAFAWTMSISAMVEIDLQKRVYDRYSGNCKRCLKRPCQCGSSFNTDERANPISTRSTDAVAETKTAD